MDAPTTAADPPAPRPGLPRTIGALDLLLGLFLGLCGGGCLVAISPFLRENGPLRIDRGPTQDVLEHMRRQIIEDLRSQSQSTTDPAEKARLAATIGEIQATSTDLTDLVDFDQINRRLPWVARYVWADAITGPVLNLAMIAAGVGLVMVTEWGRRLGIVVAVLKVVRLVVLTGMLVLMVIPATTFTLEEIARTPIGRQVVEHAMDQQRTRQPGPAPAHQLTPLDVVQVLRGLGYGSAVMMLGLGLIYPVVSLVVLTRPGARAACRRGRTPTPAVPGE